jgi:hypothetical protein
MKGTAMHYSLLVYEGPADFAARNDPAQKEAFWTAIAHYLKTLKESGVFVGGAGLQTPDTATTVRLRDGQRLVQDGPFPELKEQLGGFFIIDVPDLDKALEWAARCPSTPTRVIEVRPNLPSEE